MVGGKRSPLRVWLLCAAVTGLVASAPVSASASQEDAASADLSYVGSSTYAGAFDAQCDARYLERVDAPEQGWRIVHNGGTWIEAKTRAFLPERPREGEFVIRTAVGVSQDLTKESLAPGALVLGLDGDHALTSWLPYGLPTDHDLDDREVEYSVRFDSAQTHVSAMHGFSPATHYRWGQSNLGPVTWLDLDRPYVSSVTFGAFHESFRQVNAADESPVISGHVSIYLREAWFSQGELQHAMDPYILDGSASVAPEAYRESTFTEGYLHLRDARVVLVGGADRLVCNGLRGDFDGTVTLEGASGSLQHALSIITLENQRARYEGTFRVDEERGSIDSVTHTSHGALRSLSVDEETVVAPEGVATWASAGLWAALAGALVAGVWRLHELLAALYTRVREASLLKHPRRRLLLDIVQSNPGLSLSDLSEASQLRMGVLRHHLGLLRRAGHVDLVRNGRTVRIYKPESTRREDRARILTLRDPRYAYVRERVADAWVTQADLERALADRFDITRRGARKIIASAERFQVIERQRTPSGVEIRCPIDSNQFGTASPA